MLPSKPDTLLRCWDKRLLAAACGASGRTEAAPAAAGPTPEGPTAEGVEWKWSADEDVLLLLAVTERSGLSPRWKRELAFAVELSRMPAEGTTSAPPADMDGAAIAAASGTGVLTVAALVPTLGVEPEAEPTPDDNEPLVALLLLLAGEEVDAISTAGEDTAMEPSCCCCSRPLTTVDAPVALLLAALAEPVAPALSPTLGTLGAVGCAWKPLPAPPTMREEESEEDELLRRDKLVSSRTGPVAFDVADAGTTAEPVLRLEEPTRLSGGGAAPPAPSAKTAVGPGDDAAQLATGDAVALRL
jgi:hypothetical protein